MIFSNTFIYLRSLPSRKCGLKWTLGNGYSSGESGIINRLVDKGYIMKLPHKKDKRASALKLTEYCVEKLPDLEAINEKVINSALKELSKNDLNIFQDIINKIIQNLQ